MAPGLDAIPLRSELVLWQRLEQDSEGLNFPAAASSAAVARRGPVSLELRFVPVPPAFREEHAPRRCP